MDKGLVGAAGTFKGVREALVVEAGLGNSLSQDDVMLAINAFSVRELAASEVAVFTADICSDQVDLHFSRFPVEELEKIAGMLPGTPLMERHDVRGTLPRGTWFRSWLHWGDDGVVTVRGQVYLLRSADNAEFIAQMEAGVYREISIGFAFRLPVCSVCGEDLRTCEHVPGKTYEGEVCHYVMRDVTDVHEASLVAAGSQGVGVVSQERGKEKGGDGEEEDVRGRDFVLPASVLRRCALGEGSEEELCALREMRGALDVAIAGMQARGDQGIGDAPEVIAEDTKTDAARAMLTRRFALLRRRIRK